MGDGTAKNPYTREDVLRLIEENGGTAEGLDLTGKWFEAYIDLSKLNLTGIIFRKAQLRTANFKGSDLSNAHLERAFLLNTILENTLLVSANLENAFIVYASLEGADLMSANLKGANLEGAYLKGAKLVAANLKGTELRSAELIHAHLHRTSFSFDTEFEQVKWGPDYKIGEELDRIFESAANAYRNLKMWYTEHGIYDVAGKFFYREMEAKRKAQSWEKKPHLKLWNWVMRLLCGYGEKPERVVISALVIIFGLAIAYRFGGLSLPYSIYYSFVSFTALGYGSWVPQPTDWVKGLGVAEAVIGVFMMALFLVTFTRKMTR
jgi:hypothetical protein